MANGTSFKSLGEMLGRCLFENGDAPRNKLGVTPDTYPQPDGARMVSFGEDDMSMSVNRATAAIQNNVDMLNQYHYRLAASFEITQITSPLIAATEVDLAAFTYPIAIGGAAADSSSLFSLLDASYMPILDATGTPLTVTGVNNQAGADAYVPANQDVSVAYNVTAITRYSMTVNGDFSLLTPIVVPGMLALVAGFLNDYTYLNGYYMIVGVDGTDTLHLGGNIAGPPGFDVDSYRTTFETSPGLIGFPVEEQSANIGVDPDLSGTLQIFTDGHSVTQAKPQLSAVFPNPATLDLVVGTDIYVAHGRMTSVGHPESSYNNDSPIADVAAVLRLFNERGATMVERTQMRFGTGAIVSPVFADTVDDAEHVRITATGFNNVLHAVDGIILISNLVTVNSRCTVTVTRGTCTQGYPFILDTTIGAGNVAVDFTNIPDVGSNPFNGTLIFDFLIHNEV